MEQWQDMAMRNLFGVFNIHHAALLHMPPSVVKLTKNFTKKVCHEIGKKMTIFKK